MEAIKATNQVMKDFFSEDGFDIDDIMDTMDDMGEEEGWGEEGGFREGAPQGK